MTDLGGRSTPLARRRWGILGPRRLRWGSGRRLLPVGLAALLALTVASAAAQSGSVAAELESVTLRNLAAMQNEDVDAVAETLHSDCPGYAATLDVSDQLFRLYALDYRELDFHVVAIDGEYAYARVRQEVRKRSGPDFMDNMTDSLQVYRKDGDAWKICGTALVDLEPFGPPLAASPDTMAPADVAWVFFDGTGMDRIDCDQVPDLREPRAGALRWCGDNTAIEIPLPNDDLYWDIIDSFSKHTETAWEPLGDGRQQEFSIGGRRYVVTYRDDGYTIVDISPGDDKGQTKTTLHREDAPAH